MALEDDCSEANAQHFNMLGAALDYANTGWPVFPLRGKIPLTNHGFKEATTDEAQIRAWWTKWPEAGIGGVTGAASRCVVLDLDPRHGSDRSIAELEAKHGVPPVTPWSRTGGGGKHLIYQHPGGVIGNRAGIFLGVDVKGDGGYIVLPPSFHPSGKRYSWGQDTTIPLAPMPAWLTEALTPKPRRTQPASEFNRNGTSERYGERALREECAEVRACRARGHCDTL